MILLFHADVAQLVERNLAKVEVAGSNLVIRSNNLLKRLLEFMYVNFVWH
jgi:hypothetical protein